MRRRDGGVGIHVFLSSKSARLPSDRCDMGERIATISTVAQPEFSGNGFPSVSLASLDVEAVARLLRAYSGEWDRESRFGSMKRCIFAPTSAPIALSVRYRQAGRVMPPEDDRVRPAPSGVVLRRSLAFRLFPDLADRRYSASSASMDCAETAPAAIRPPALNSVGVPRKPSARPSARF